MEGSQTLKPPTYWATKNTPIRILVLALVFFLPLVSPTKCNCNFAPTGHEAFETNGARKLPYVRPFDTGGYKILIKAITILRTIKLPTNNAEYTSYSILIIIGKTNGVGCDNIKMDKDKCSK